MSARSSQHFNGLIRRWRALLMVAVGLAASAVVSAERLPFKTYTTADGLPHSDVNHITRDSRGFLWFCTFEGLSRFDGYGFTTYGVEQGLPSPVINDLLETHEGDYWVATAAGLCRFNPKGIAQKYAAVGAPQAAFSNAMFTVYFPGEAAASRNVAAVFEDRSGVIWCGTAGGLYRVEEEDGRTNFRQVELGMTAEVTAIIEDRRGALWVSSTNGLYRRLPDGRVERFHSGHGLPDPSIWSLLEDREGRIWIGTRTAGLCRLVAEPDLRRTLVARQYTKRDWMTGERLRTAWINQIFQASDGSMWAGSNAGLIRLVPTADGRDYRLRAYSQKHGLSYHEVKSLAEDRDGNLWLGMLNGGAIKFARSGISAFTEADGFKWTTSLFKDRAGDFLVKASPGFNILDFIYRYDGERFTGIQFRLPKGAGYSWLVNQVVLQDRAGEWWVATTKGICRYPKVDRFERLARMSPKAIYTTRNGLGGNIILSLFEDARGDIWISTGEDGRGLARWERAAETFHRYTEADGLPSFAAIHPVSFCEDRAGGVWIGFSFGGGLARYRNGRFTRFTSSDGLAEGGIFNLFVDSSGRLWVATTRGGLCRIDHPEAERPQIRTYTTPDGLSSNNVTCVTEDRWGRIYVGTARGIDRLDTATQRIKHYTAADGLLLGTIGAALQDRDGSLWFSFAAGLVRLVPEPDRPPLSPPVLITRLRIAGELQPISALGETDAAPVELGADKNQLQVEYVALGFGPGEGLRYQHKLEGAGEDWSPPSEQRTVNFASLAPGRYRLLVRAVNADDVTSERPASFRFTILPPLWRRWWFVGLATGLLGSLVYSMFRYRLARLLELERVRTRIAADLHDDIGAGLSRMAILSEVVKRQIGGNGGGEAGGVTVTPLLTEIADSARALLAAMREIVWAIDPQRASLDNLAAQIRQFTSDLLEAQAIRWEFRVPEEMDRIKLDPEQRRQLLLIFKEALHNIERHSGCETVTLSIALSHHRLAAEIRDDGHGFVVPTGPTPRTSGRGNGLENMRQRAAHLGGHLDIRSAPGQGTHLELTIPLKRR